MLARRDEEIRALTMQARSYKEKLRAAEEDSRRSSRKCVELQDEQSRLAALVGDKKLDERADLVAKAAALQDLVQARDAQIAKLEHALALESKARVRAERLAACDKAAPSSNDASVLRELRQAQLVIEEKDRAIAALTRSQTRAARVAPATSPARSPNKSFVAQSTIAANITLVEADIAPAPTRTITPTPTPAAAASQPAPAAVPAVPSAASTFVTERTFEASPVLQRNERVAVEELEPQQQELARVRAEQERQAVEAERQRVAEHERRQAAEAERKRLELADLERAEQARMESEARRRRDEEQAEQQRAERARAEAEAQLAIERAREERRKKDELLRKVMRVCVWCGARHVCRLQRWTSRRRRLPCPSSPRLRPVRARRRRRARAR